MKYIVTVMLLLVAAFAVAVPAEAQTKPIQLALFNPVQIFPEKESIAGLRISLLYGSNADMTGLDWGLVTMTTGEFQGLQLGGVGIVKGDATGIQSNLVSITKGTFTGVQWWSWYNSANRAVGLQVGLVNSAGTMKGLQIGLLNFIREGGFLPFFPIVNGSF